MYLLFDQKDKFVCDLISFHSEKRLMRFYLLFLKKALTLAGQTLQKSSQALPNFVVVFVEGQQYLSSSLVLLRNAVKPLQALGVTVFVVGIGNRLNSQELVSMVQNSEHIVRVTGFADLLRQVESIAQLIGKRRKAAYNFVIDRLTDTPTTR